MKLLPRRRILRLAIYIVSFALVVIAGDLVLVEVRRQIHPGYGTTRLIAPVLPDGRIDYLTAMDDMASDGITPQNNAAVLILQALGRKGLASNQPENGVTNRLGMSPLPQNGDYFVTYDDYCTAHSITNTNDPAFEVPTAFPLKLPPSAADYLKINQKPLDLIIEASGRPRFFIPFYAGYRVETVADVLLPHLGLIRQANQALVMRALIDLDAADFAGFRDNLLAAHRLARLISNQRTYIDRLLACHFESTACEAARTALAGGKLTADQIRALAADYAGLSDLPRLDPAIDNERVFGLDIMQAMAHAPYFRSGEIANSVISRDFLPPAIVAFLPIPYEGSMRTINRMADGNLAALQQPTYAKQVDALQRFYEDTRAQAGNEIVSLVTPNFPIPFVSLNLTKILGSYDRARMELTLTRTAMALAQYNADHHAYPATLAELDPTYLPAVPEDIFTDHPPIYAPKGDGYTLYSVGPNMIDDGGIRDKTDDLVASLP